MPVINFYKTIAGRVLPVPAVEDGCWVSAICPTEQEVRYLVDILGLEQDFVRAALDEEESARIERDGDQTLIIVDIPLCGGRGQWLQLHHRAAWYHHGG